MSGISSLRSRASIPKAKAVSKMAKTSIFRIMLKSELSGLLHCASMLPLLPDREGSVREERRIVDEARKILQDDGLMISASVVQSPVFYGHAQMVSFEAMRPLAAEEARDAFTRGEDIELSEEGEFPTQVGDASGNARLSIGCVHNDYGMPEQIQFWSVADNVRFGGALMAVKIAEKLIEEYLY